MRISKGLVLTSFILLSAVVFGQKKEPEIKPGKPNQLDKQYDPPTNSPLIGGSSSSSSSSFRDYSNIKNVVKINFGMFARSTAALYYQRNFTEDLAVQGGIGYVYNYDKAQFLTGGASGELDLSDGNNSALSLERVISDGKYVQGFNPFLTASVRFRFDGLFTSYWYYSSGENNNYIDLGVRFYNQHYKLSSLKGDNSYEKLSGPANVKVGNVCYTLLYGYIFEAGSKVVTNHEFYWGFGIRRSTYNSFKVEQTYNPTTYNTMNVYSLDGSKSKSLTPMFMIGYVLGFGF